ncbi:uncharacterized protein [Pseudorasbora parva]|uniref:uncharacterized protein isoform X1 n=1 Tax=Pseudorasbora parva TaxID=51549 RepID=UPI00351F70B1
MPRPKKRSTIAKRLYALRCATEAAPLPLKRSQAEAAPLPLKISKAEVSPLPRKTKVDLPVISVKCHCAKIQQFPLRPAIKRVEAAPLPLKTSEAEVPPYPLKKLADNERLCSLSEHSRFSKVSKSSLSVPKSSPSVSKSSQSVSKSLPSVSIQSVVKTSQLSVKSSRESAERFVIPTKLNENILNTITVHSDFPQKSVLKGSFHQGDARFGDLRNRQCGAISLTAVLTSKMKNVLSWTTQDLDGVLVAGTNLYESLRNQGNINDQEVMGRHYIAVHELPRRHVLGNTKFSIEYAESLTGFVNVSEYDEALSGVVMPLDVALQQALLSANAFLLTICANTCAVIKEGSWYAFVDSHANKTDTSCVAYHSTIESLYNYINEIAQSFGEHEPQFEITGLLVHADAEVSHSLEAGCSSFPCSSSKPLYSKVLKCTPKVCKSVTTEVRSFEFEVTEVANTSTNLPMLQPVCNVLPSKGKRGRRKKLDEQVSGKLVKTCHVENVLADDIIITDVSIPEVFFSPLTLKDQQALCEVVLLTNDNSVCDVITHFGPIAGPCQTKSIKKDGNCFFRCLAYAVCRSEDKHLKIRRAVVKHLKMNASIFESIEIKTFVRELVEMALQMR